MRECLSTIGGNSHPGHLHSGGRCCMRGELEQVWYLKAISTGVMNMVMGSGEAAGRRRMQMQFAQGPLQMRCARPATPQFHLTPERMAEPRVHLQSINPLPPPPPHLRDETRRGRGEARLFGCGNFSGMAALINEPGFKLSIRPVIA